MKRLLIAGLIVLASSVHAQTISYVLPDAAAPGMAVYAEILGPNSNGNFGPDGLNQVDIQLIDPLDAARFVVGPRITSWDGRLISMFVLIAPTASVGPVPFRVSTASGLSNVDTFYIVQAQTLRSDLAAGSLGSGGDYGTRSRRNTLVVESLHLGQGSFTVSNLDPDPNTPGNQAYLPFTIVSKGDIVIDGSLSVDGVGKNGIAGGGGAGGKERTEGGDGYTGGGGMHGIGGVGSGGEHSSWNGGPSLCGTPGARGLGDRWWDDQGGGGGTGFPFGTGGVGGTWYQEGGNNPPGGIGGGSGGGERSEPDSSFGGGGGAFATDGGNSGTSGPNGGRAYGNSLIVPFCGGSGGGGGNQFGDGRAGDGGAGGGAIHLLSMSRITVNGSLTANGADGESTHGVFKGGGGGGGAGGAIALTAPFISINGHLSAQGGKGGAAVLQPVRGGLPGGNGGNGRIRLVGLIDHDAENNDSYHGPSPAQLQSIGGQTHLMGRARPGDSIIIYAQTNGQWQYSQPLACRTTGDGNWDAICPAAMLGATRISVLEQIESPATSPYISEPRWILSPESVIALKQSTEAAPIQQGISLSVASITQVAGAIRFEIESNPNSEAQMQVFDMLGRVLGAESVVIDGAGHAIWKLSSRSMPTGAYIMKVTSDGHTISHSFSVAH